MTYFKTFIRGTLFVIIALITMSTVLHPDVTAAEPTTVIHIPTIDYAPLMGLNGGVMTDIVKESFITVGIGVEYKLMPMARIIWAVTNEKAPAVVGSMAWFQKSEGLEELHPVTIYYTAFHFFYLKQRFPNGVSFDTLEDLKGYKIGYIRGGGLTPLFQKANIEPDWVTDLAQNAKKLFLGRIDMHAATELAGWGIIQKLYPENVNAIAMTEKPIHTIDGHIIFSKNQHALKQQFERGFKIIQKNGTYLKVLKRYYGERQIPEKAIKLIEETTTIY